MPFHIENHVSKFDGSGDVEVFLEKVQLCKKLKPSECGDLEIVLPMLLEGDAFAMYMELNEEVRKSPSGIISHLRKSFGKTSFAAYDEFLSRQFRDETPDVFANDLRKLASVFCNKVDEGLLKVAFIKGFPPHISEQLRLSCNSDDSMSSLIDKAKLLVAGSDAFAGVQSYGAAGSRNVRNRGRGRANMQFAPRCYGCDRIGHVRSQCRIKCVRCGQIGHVAFKCDQPPVSGNVAGADQSVLEGSPPL